MKGKSKQNIDNKFIILLAIFSILLLWYTIWNKKPSKPNIQ
jgi:hypothetical protein